MADRADLGGFPSISFDRIHVADVKVYNGTIDKHMAICCLAAVDMALCRGMHSVGSTPDFDRVGL